MQRSDRWTGDGKLTVIKCLARWSEWLDWREVDRSSGFSWFTLAEGSCVLGSEVWVAGSEVSVAGSEVSVARAEVSVAGLEVWVAGSEVLMAGKWIEALVLSVFLCVLCFSSLFLSVLLCILRDPEMNWSENESVNSFSSQMRKFLSTGIQFLKNCIFRCNQTCRKMWKWFPEIIFTQHKRNLSNISLSRWA